MAVPASKAAEWRCHALIADWNERLDLFGSGWGFVSFHRLTQA